MERTEWLKQIRDMAEVLYDQFSPRYWVTFGLYPNETHLEFLQKFLGRVPPHSALLSAACGAGRYDGILLEAGHHVIGIDQSEGMLGRAKERFPKAVYQKMGLQEMDFHEEFEGVICMDAMEHICPEDWPVILSAFSQTLKTGGRLYFTLDLADADEVEAAFKRGKELGLPVMFGEVADRVEEAYEQAVTLGQPLSGDVADGAVYHNYPPLEQVRVWLRQAGLEIEEEGTGNWYHHFLVRKI
jgi:SAM-dependent methyltransferase